jgi:hypothetical protein
MIWTLPYDRLLCELQSSYNDDAINGITLGGCATTLESMDTLSPINYKDALGHINTLDPDDSFDDLWAHSLDNLFTLDPNDSLVSDLYLTHYLQYL